MGTDVCGGAQGRLRFTRGWLAMQKTGTAAEHGGSRLLGRRNTGGSIAGHGQPGPDPPSPQHPQATEKVVPFRGRRGTAGGTARSPAGGSGTKGARARAPWRRATRAAALHARQGGGGNAGRSPGAADSGKCCQESAGQARGGRTRGKKKEGRTSKVLRHAAAREPRSAHPAPSHRP